jgi:hypothetical protein
MDITPETVHIILDAARDKEIKELTSTNNELRKIIEKTIEALNYFPMVKDHGQGTSSRRSREQTETHLRTGEDTSRDQGLPESK